MSKKPINNKAKVSKGRISKPDFAVSNFEIPRDVAEEISKRGYEPRYVSIKQVQDFGGQHRRGWMPYQMSSDLLAKRKASIGGVDPDGFLRRGDLILAVKKKEDAEHHRKWSAQEAEDARVSNLQKRKYQEAKDYIKDAGLSDTVKVLTGYENN